jgi:DNA-directed RNA polymerase
MKTVNACNDRGMIDFAMVHDSFGCHACHVDELNAVLREEFIGMYSVSRLQEFKEQSEALLGEELPTIPSMGDLELDQVEESDFFFS